MGVGIRILSDLHLEWLDDPKPILDQIPPVDGEEIVILAGDISAGKKFKSQLTSLIERLSSGKHEPTIIYVAGNHTYWARPQSEVDQDIEDIKAEYANFVPLTHRFMGTMAFLGNGRPTVGFMGGTLWFPKTEDSDNQLWRISDSVRIPDFPGFAYKSHEDTRERIHNGLSKRAGDRLVVVTHHIPFPELIPSKYKGSKINCYFCADLSLEDFSDIMPDLWAFGHTHESMDREVNGTRFICNPMGYPKEGHLNLGFDPHLIVEI